MATEHLLCTWYVDQCRTHHTCTARVLAVAMVHANSQGYMHTTCYYTQLTTTRQHSEASTLLYLAYTLVQHIHIIRSLD